MSIALSGYNYKYGELMKILIYYSTTLLFLFRFCGTFDFNLILEARWIDCFLFGI